MIDINFKLEPADFLNKLIRFWDLSGQKIRLIETNYDESQGSPVFTVKGKYFSRGWTEWTQGFQYGSAVLQFDATGDEQMLVHARKKILDKMAPHISHTGVHDHGFNNVSTYGNLLRLMKEGRVAYNDWEKISYELALKISGAVQASRWSPLKNGGFIYSFNGPHSLFVDTIRSCRSLMISHQLGHTLQGEGDLKISLLERAIEHIKATAAYSVYYGEGRDNYDVRGRTAHESIFNIKDGNYRCPGTQQGYSPFSTWTRGLAWVLLGFAEQLEFLSTLSRDALDPFGGKEKILDRFLQVAEATADYYINESPTDGIPYWDTGAPGLANLGRYQERPANPLNDFEPVDSSAAVIAAQGFIRLGGYLKGQGVEERGQTYYQAGLTISRNVFAPPYLSSDPDHEGLILHSVYHRPNGWDYIPPGRKIPCGEASMWGDYHARELGLLLLRIATGKPYYAFFLK